MGKIAPGAKNPADKRALMDCLIIFIIMAVARRLIEGGAYSYIHVLPISNQIQIGSI